MTRYIDADLMKRAYADLLECDFPNRTEETLGELINAVPTEDVAPVKHGNWKQISPAKIYECSVCGQNVMTSDIDAYKFCHGCGSRMDG